MRLPHAHQLQVQYSLDRFQLEMAGPGIAREMQEQARLSMARSLGEAAVERGAVWSETIRVDLPGCPQVLNAQLFVVDKEGLRWYTQAQRTDGPWWARLARRVALWLMDKADR